MRVVHAVAAHGVLVVTDSVALHLVMHPFVQVTPVLAVTGPPVVATDPDLTDVLAVVAVGAQVAILPVVTLLPVMVAVVLIRPGPVVTEAVKTLDDADAWVADALTYAREALAMK